MKLFDTDFGDRLTVEADHAWMERMVREIRQHLPRMLRDHSRRGEFWDWFCGEAESLFRYVRHDEDRLYFQDFMNKTLEDAGLEERFDLTRRDGDPSCAELPPPRADDRSDRALRPGDAATREWRRPVAWRQSQQRQGN